MLQVYKCTHKDYQQYTYRYCREWESTSPSASFSRTSAAVFMRIIILKLKHAAVFMRIAQKVDGGALQGTASSDHTQMHWKLQQKHTSAIMLTMNTVAFSLNHCRGESNRLFLQWVSKRKTKNVSFTIQTVAFATQDHIRQCTCCCVCNENRCISQ